MTSPQPTSDEREERQRSNLTKRDKTRFLERGFTVVENVGHSLRLIKRDDARQAISIKWDDLPALRELITLALDDGPMVIGLDTSGQSAKNAALAMRDKCVETVKVLRDEWYERVEQAEVDSAVETVMYSRVYGADKITAALESLSLDQAKQEKQQS